VPVLPRPTLRLAAGYGSRHNSWRATSTDRCPCLSGLTYGGCCERLHRGTATAQTAEQLMRSRYSAFAVGDRDYLLATWHPTTRPATLELVWQRRWHRLDVLAIQGGGPFETAGVIEYAAHYREPEGDGIQHEVCRFVREGCTWLYVDGTL
jgi:SEC-C motif-containing protein